MGASQSIQQQQQQHSKTSWKILQATKTACDAAPPAPPPLEGQAPPPPPSEVANSSPADSIEAAAQFVSAVPNPGPLEHFGSDVKNLVMLDAKEGLRFDIAKQLSPYMACFYSFWLGAADPMSGATYNRTFMAQVASEEGFVALSRLDIDNGMMMGRLMSPMLGGAAMGKLMIQMNMANQDASQDVCLADVDFGGMTWTGNLKYGVMGGSLQWGVNYFQGITPNLAAGAEAMWDGREGRMQHTYSFKYAMPAKSGEETDSIQELKPKGEASSTMYLQVDPNSAMLTASYKRVVTPGRVTLGSELQVGAQNPTGTFLLGGEFSFTRSKVSMMVNGSGRIVSVVEANMGMGQGAPTLKFSADVDHLQNKYNFGYGLNIQG
jgi:mitochondrial import receptor subunit TOM40